VPYEIAFQLDEAARLAHVVVLGQLDGLIFDWRRLGWVGE
jgi:hypothetical protein